MHVLTTARLYAQEKRARDQSLPEIDKVRIGASPTVRLPRRAVQHTDGSSPLTPNMLSCVQQKKFLVPADLTIQQFVYVIRKVLGDEGGLMASMGAVVNS